MTRNPVRAGTRPPRGAASGRDRAVVDRADRRLEAAQVAVLCAALALSAVLVWRPLIDPFMVVKAAAVALSAVVLVALAGVRALRAGELRLPAAAPVVAGGALAVAIVLATLPAPNAGAAWFGQHGRSSGAVTYLACLVVFAAAVRLLARQDAVVALVRTFVVTLGVVTAYGLVQVAGLDPWSWRAGLDEPIFSTLGNTNFAAAYVACVLPVLAAAVLGVPGLARHWRWVAGVVGVLALGYVVLTRASQGPAAAAAGLGVVGVGWWLHHRRRRAARGERGRWWLPALAGLGVLVVGAGAVSLIAGDVEASLRERRQFWAAALDVFRDHPVLGAGLDTFRDTFPLYRPAEHGVPRGFQITDAVHDIPLAMLSSGGLVLAAAYAAFVVLVGAVLVRGLFTAPTDRLPALGAFGGMWTAYQVQSLVSLDVPPIVLLHYLSAGAVVALATAPRRVSLALPTPAARSGAWLPTRTPAVLAAVAVLAAATLAGAATVARPLVADAAAARGDGVRGDWAYERYGQAVALAPWEAEYRVFQAQAAARDNELERTLALTARAADLRPGSSRLALSAAEVALRLDEPDTAAAVRWVREAVRRDPVNPDAMVLGAKLAEQAGDEQLAEELRARARELEERYG